MQKQCPCHSGKNYSECCQPYHNGTLPQNALALMRSRYAAFASQKPEYIIQTTHPKNSQYRPNDERWSKEILSFCQGTQFVGLEIVDFIDGEQEAFVTFVARLKNKNGSDCSFMEKSRFEKLNGRWLYLEAVSMYRAAR